MEKILRSILADISDIKATKLNTRRFDRIDQRLEAIETGCRGFHGGLDRLEQCLTPIDQRMDRVAKACGFRRSRPLGGGGTPGIRLASFVNERGANRSTYQVIE